MVAWIALGLSIFNLLMWIAVAIGIRKVFRKLLPMFQMMGITSSQNLTYSTVSDRIPVPSELGNAKTDK